MIIDSSKTNYTWLFYAIIAAVAGVLSICYPFNDNNAELYIILMGGLICLLGVANLVYYTLANKKVAQPGILQLNGFFTVTVGIMCFATSYIGSVLMTSYFIIIWLMYIGCARINYALLIKKNFKEWLLSLIAGMVLIALCLFNIIYPFDNEPSLIFMGATLIVSGAWALTTFLYNLIRKTKKPDAVSEKVKETETLE